MPDMRFAPPPSLKITDRGGGLNQVSVRTYNERLVMSLLRQHQHLSRLELGRFSGLSAQTISVIVRALERDGLILRGEAQRGKVGPPTIPMTLNPEGAYSIGIKIGKKTTDIVLVNFLGDIVDHIEHPYSHPDHDKILEFIKTSLNQILDKLTQAQKQRLSGIGLSLPADLESWSEQNWPNQSNEQPWNTFDFESAIEQATGLATYIQNDVTAAASAEILFGGARTFDDFAYFFIGEHSSIRIVLDHRVYAGRRSQSTLPIKIPSIDDLEKTVAPDGEILPLLWQHEANWEIYKEEYQGWLQQCSSDLATTINTMTQFVDIETAIIDGRMPENITKLICETASENLQAAGNPTHIIAGQIGSLAKAIGAASMPFYAKYMVQEIGLAAD